MDYIPHTPADREKIMQTLGIDHLEDLFADLPEKFRLKRLLSLPSARSEQEVRTLMQRLGEQNQIPNITLTGAGAYHHYIPAVVGHILSRSEFYTAYTPYQAEISQGILQAIYEYQTMIAGLTGLPVANASMYDGASAMAEAAVLAARTLNRAKIVILRSVHPQYRQVVKTYAWSKDYEVVEVPFGPDGRLDRQALADAVDQKTAAVLVQTPNFFGIVEDLAGMDALVHAHGALLISGFTDATSLGILKPAGAMGADFVVGEGQAFGNPLNYGGPYLGIFAAAAPFLRKIPGRLAGATVDADGKRGFVLTLQTREQHIRREKATSNICSNEALCALAATVYLACLGKNLRALAILNVQKAQYLRQQLSRLDGWTPVFQSPVYNEFALRCPDAAAVNRRLEVEGIAGGYALEQDYPELKDTLLFCATEMLSREDMDRIVAIVG